MRTIRLSLSTLLATLLLALGGPAVAGVADSPLPLLQGQSSKHIFTIPGVISNAVLATVFVCTSLEKKKNLSFGVEIFGSSGGAPEGASVAQDVTPGQSRAAATQGTTYVESIISLSDNSFPRSARIVATSTKLTCSATVLERQDTDSLPGVGWSLPVIKKTNQKGD